MSNICITNNPLVISKHLPLTEFVNGDNLELFKLTKEKILQGHKLVTHPLSGSIRPDISPYKSIILSSAKDKKSIDRESLDLVGKAIAYTSRLLADSSWVDWDEKSLNDFQLVDYDLIKDYL